MPPVEPDKHTPWAQPAPPASASPPPPSQPPPPSPVAPGQAATAPWPPVAPTAPTAPRTPAPPPPPQPGYAPNGYPAFGQSSSQPNQFTDDSDQERQIRTFGKRLILVGLASLLAVVAIGLFGGRFSRTWDPALEPYVAYVEAERGLTFVQPVGLRRGNIADELQHSAPEETVAPEEDPWGQAYELLGLVDLAPTVTAEQSEFETLSENAGAFYDPASETIVLPEGASDLELSVTIVHELTHALQHQHGMLGSGAFETPDSAVARRVLIEGDAERIANAWYWDQPESFRTDYLEAIGYDPDVTPDDPGDNFLVTSFFASYDVGLPMVQAIVEVEGQAGIDELLRSKDVGTTERLIDVFGDSRQPTVDAFAEMTLPEGSDGVIGDLGPFTLFQALAPTIGTGETLDALIGYDNDAFAIFEQDGQTCARVSVFFENAAEGQEFVSVLDAADVGGTRELNGTEAIVDLCDPIGDPELQRFGTILPLIVAQEAVLSHVIDGVPIEQARCAALAQASTIPADQPSSDFVGWEPLAEQMPQFLADCK